MAVLRLRLAEDAFPRVALGTGAAVGGDQAWLEAPLSRRTCCGGVSMLNILLSLTRRCGEVLSQEEFLRAYYALFPRRRPLAGFVPLAKGYRRRMKKLLARREASVRPRTLSALSAPPEAAMEEIAASLAQGRPCALQNWFGCKKPVFPWHWVTVLGADVDEERPENSALYVSSWGRVYRYPLPSAWRGKASLVTFREEPAGR